MSHSNSSCIRLHKIPTIFQTKAAASFALQETFRSNASRWEKLGIIPIRNKPQYKQKLNLNSDFRIFSPLMDIPRATRVPPVFLPDAFTLSLAVRIPRTSILSRPHFSMSRFLRMEPALSVALHISRFRRVYFRCVPYPCGHCPIMIYNNYATCRCAYLSIQYDSAKCCAAAR